MSTTDVRGLPIASARANLGTFILGEANRQAMELGFKWRADGAAPSQYHMLQSAYQLSVASKTDMPVSSLYCENTIYTSPDTNYAFRFWHDIHHIHLGLTFALDDEYEVSSHHLWTLRRAGFAHNSLEYRMLEADTTGQTYCLDVLNRFPRHQLRFAIWCTTDGIEEAVAYEAAGCT